MPAETSSHHANLELLLDLASGAGVNGARKEVEDARERSDLRAAVPVVRQRDRHALRVRLRAAGARRAGLVHGLAGATVDREVAGVDVQRAGARLRRVG